MVRRTLFILFAVCVAFGATSHAAESAKSDLTISDNRVVSIDYTLFVDGNKIIETTKGKQPLVYVQGKGQVLKALEDALKGLGVGEKKTVVIAPKDAYGEVRKDFFVEIPLEKLPEGANAEGEAVTVTGKEAGAKSVVCKVGKIGDKTAILDFNHSLAGKELTYKVEVVDVRDLREF